MDDTIAVLLIVEDDPMQAVVLEDLLNDGGYTVVVANDGNAAIRILESDENKIRGMISDVQLGNGPNGWDVAQRARELNPLLPVVYVSGDSAGDWASKGVPNSVMISKPFAPAQVLTAISTLLNDLHPTG